MPRIKGTRKAGPWPPSESVWLVVVTSSVSIAGTTWRARILLPLLSHEAPRLLSNARLSAGALLHDCSIVLRRCVSTGLAVRHRVALVCLGRPTWHSRTLWVTQLCPEVGRGISWDGPR